MVGHLRCADSPKQCQRCPVPAGDIDALPYLLGGRNLTNVWNVSMGQTRESHYAVFPPALIERPVAMTCPLEITELGPKRRIVEMVPYAESRPFNRGIGKYTKPEEETRLKSGRQDTGRQYIPRKPVTMGWEPDLPSIRRGIVLDPFCGTATAGEVALKLGRHFIGIELYENNAQIAEDRCRQAHLLRGEYEARNPIKASTASFDEALNDTMPDEGKRVSNPPSQGAEPVLKCGY